MKPRKVPIVAYHSVADDHDHLLRHLSLPVDSFEKQLRYLERRGFTTVTLYDAHAHLEGGAPLPARAVALTFDDGYLDSWVHAFPLLRKYGMKATIFVVTDFVDPRSVRRPNLEDVWAGRARRSELEWWGHASWLELREMQKSGLVDVQSHTRTHTWYFVSDEITDFHHPEDDYYWLYWNRNPEEKPGWLTADFGERVPWGTPVYEHDQTLLKPRYFDDPGLAAAVTEHVAHRGGREFFVGRRWKEELLDVAACYRSSRGSHGRFETESEYRDRVVNELAESRRIIAERLEKEVDFLCWPCGDYTEELQRLALECGYRATVNVAKKTNRRGDDPRELNRIVFGQDYTGPFRSALVHWHFCGNVSYQSGRNVLWPLAPVARRLMMLLRRLG